MISWKSELVKYIYLPRGLVLSKWLKIWDRVQHILTHILFRILTNTSWWVVLYYNIALTSGGVYSELSIRWASVDDA